MLESAWQECASDTFSETQWQPAALGFISRGGKEVWPPKQEQNQDRLRAMNSRHLAVFFVFALLAILAVWVFYPTHIPATLYVGNKTNKPEFVQLKKEFLRFGNADTTGQYRIAGDASNYGTIALYCEGEPIVILFDHPSATTMMAFDQMYERTSAATKFVEEIALRMGPSVSATRPKPEDTPTKLDRFFLKYRDGTDLSRKCK